MTKFADPKFSVAAPLTEAYAEGHARTFPASLDEKACTECLGTGCEAPVSSGVKIACLACHSTGLRAWQGTAK